MVVLLAPSTSSSDPLHTPSWGGVRLFPLVLWTSVCGLYQREGAFRLGIGISGHL